MTIRKHVGGLPRQLQTLSRVYRTARSGRTTGAALTKQFSTTNTPFRGQNVLAKYAPGALPVQRALQTDETFLTSATQPVATSFQTVPPPSSSAEQDGIIIKDPVPAMIPLSISSIDSAPKESSQKRGEIIVQGIPIPPKPTPPGEEDCCMGGCVHCVYNIYADDLEQYTESLKSARKALVAAAVPKSEWPEEIRGNAGDEDGMAEKAKREVRESIDPSMAAFLALEGKLKKKQVV